MGVVYKLKDEVVEFILRQKQQNPNISCRKLVDIIQETFQISVSKSSINTIIKQNNLSNPVGRTPGSAKIAFKIPQEKKTELFFKAKSTLEDVLGAPLPAAPAAPVNKPQDTPKPPPAPVMPPLKVQEEPKQSIPEPQPDPEPEPKIEPAPDPEPVPEPVFQVEPVPQPEAESQPVENETQPEEKTALLPDIAAAPATPEEKVEKEIGPPQHPVTDEEVPPQAVEPAAAPETQLQQEEIITPPAVQTQPEMPSTIQPEIQPEPSAEIQKIDPIDQDIVEPEEQDAEPADEPRISLLPDPIAQPPSQEAAEPAAIPSSASVPAPEKDPGRQFEAADLKHLFLRCALWDLTQRPFLEKFLKNRTDFSDEDIAVLDTLFCLSGPVFDNPVQALEAGSMWMWYLNGFEAPPDLEKIQSIIRRAEAVMVDEFDFFLEAGYLFTFVREIKICLKDRSIVRLDSRFSNLTKNGETFSPIDSSVEKITRFITSPDSQTVVQGSPFAGLFDEAKNFIAACESSVNKEIEKIILMDAGGKPITEFTEIPHLKRNFVLNATVSAEQVKELLGVSFDFQEERKVVLHGVALYCAESMLELKLSDLPGDQINLKIRAYSKSLESNEIEISIGSAEHHMEFYPGSASPEDNTQVIDIKEFVDILNQNGGFAASNQQKPLGQCLRLIKQEVEKYAQALFRGSKDVSQLLATIYILSESRDISVGLPPADNAIGWDKNWSRIINSCKLMDYKNRPFSIYNKI